MENKNGRIPFPIEGVWNPAGRATYAHAGASAGQRDVAEDQACAADVGGVRQDLPVRQLDRRTLGAHVVHGHAGVVGESRAQQRRRLAGGQVGHHRLLGFGGQQRRLVGVGQQRARGRGRELGLLRLAVVGPLGGQLVHAVLVAVRGLQLVHAFMATVLGSEDVAGGFFRRVDLHLAGLGVGGVRRAVLRGVERGGRGGADQGEGSESCQGMLQFHGELL